eukprot:2484326-Prymnesium_polylepis.1
MSGPAGRGLRDVCRGVGAFWCRVVCGAVKGDIKFYYPDTFEHLHPRPRCPHSKDFCKES